MAMEWLKDLALPLATTAVWATMLGWLGKHVTNKFQATIESTAQRLTRIGPAEFLSQPSQASTSAPDIEATATLPAERLPSDSPDMTKRLELVREWLETIPAEKREAELVRNAASWQLGWMLEALNFQILGSQIALLGTLNSQSLTVDEAMAFYAKARAAAPDIYGNYLFEGWLGWLRDTAEVVQQSDDILTISPTGRELLKYIVSRGYPTQRFS
jgi:hypothetical protein